MGDRFFRFRLASDMRRLLNRLRDEKDINLSRWVQRQVRNALQREFPDSREPEPPQTPTIGTREVPEPDHAAIKTPKKPPIATTETQEPEPPQTPTIGTREVPEPDHAATKTPKKPPIATTETREPEPPQTPTIGTREVPEPDHAATKTPKKPPIATTETREPEPPQTPTIGTREVPEPDHAATKTPKKPPINGWKPRRLDTGEWGAVLEGEKVAELPDSDQLPGTAISVTDNKGDSWTTTIVAVVSRSDADVVVTNAGRPRD